VAVRQTWGEYRVFFLDQDGTQRSLPAGWTDAVAVDVFVAMAAGRSPFRVEDLVCLAELIDRFRAAADEGCKADSAVPVNGILPVTVQCDPAVPAMCR